jgi:Na+/proline symporter/signal transduction histidine kinase/CheY-like chemotaxis protein
MFEFMQINYLLLLAFLYAVLLFFIAGKAERTNLQRAWYNPLIYSLSLAVYCTSWTFFGAVGMATESGWGFFAIYLGPILLFVFGWPFLRRLLVFSSRNKVTSIADFIGSRFGKRQTLASLVTIIALVGTLPYIALQLRAVSLAWAAIDTPSGEVIRVGTGTSFIGALVMAWFAILFGTKVVEGNNRMKGLISAVALESLVKLFAFVAVGVTAWTLIPNPTESITTYFTATEKLPTNAFVTQTLLAMMAIVCLPRQFHVMVVEPHTRQDVRWARWTFPLYLFIFSLMVLPIAVAGAQFFSGTTVPSDLYVLQLPMFLGNEHLAAVAFIGGLSAAAGMIIVASVTLSIMVSNEIVVPILLNIGRRGSLPSRLAGNLRMVRRVTIVMVLVMAWWVDSALQQPGGLASLGLISFAAAAQFMPAIVAGLYWPNAHRNGVLLGMLIGIVVWFYTLFLPALLGAQHSLVTEGPFGLAFLSPYNILGLTSLDNLTRGVLLSLSLNCLMLWWGSRHSKFNTLDLRQTEAFTKLRSQFGFRQQDFELSSIEGRQLQAILDPLVGETRSGNIWMEFEQRLGHRLLPHDKVPRFVVFDVENHIARIIGAVSAHRVIDMLRRQEPMALEDFASFLGGSNQVARFSQNLLQTTLENIPQGISVVDKDLHLMAWNKKYERMFSFPPRLLFVGCPIERVYRFNASRGYLGGDQDEVDAIVQKRLDLLKLGDEYRIERELPTGAVIEIRGTPLGEGGYVTTYTDISDFHNILEELENAKLLLEERVKERTQALLEVNNSMRQENLLRARLEQELNDAYASKTQFLAAASHDLLQPINAARLFVSAIQAREELASSSGMHEDIVSIDSALSGAEDLISALREIARLDSGKMIAKKENFQLDDLMKVLTREMKLFAEQKQLDFHYVSCRQWVYTDPALLRRILQNFLANAVRYTPKGRILFGCRRQQNALQIQVWDTGPGIAEQDQERIFKEFERLSDSRNVDGQKGLGLGLSISQRIGQILGHPINMVSRLGIGTMFSVTVPLGKAIAPSVVQPRVMGDLKDLLVLCIDNELQIVQGMRALMEKWGCRVVTASNLASALNNWQLDIAPDIIVADYHLDDGELGTTLIDALRLRWDAQLPALIISADDSEPLKQELMEKNIKYLSKPVPAAALRGTMRSLVRDKKQSKPG